MPTYFVYGALMAHPLVKRNGQAAYIKNYAVEMRLVGGARLIEPSFAVLFKNEKNTAWGVAATLTEKEWRKISGHEENYSLSTLTATTVKGKSLSVQALISKNVYPYEVIPSARYAKILYKSACYYVFPDNTKAKYLYFLKKGNKATLYAPWYVPVCKKLIPYLGVKKAIRTVIGIHIVAFAVIIAGAIHFL
jgi:hypothetical protein